MARWPQPWLIYSLRWAEVIQAAHATERAGGTRGQATEAAGEAPTTPVLEVFIRRAQDASLLLGGSLGFYQRSFLIA